MPSFIRATGPDGWLTAAADWGRLIWGAFYWNGQKTWFRVRGARGRAPCQHPSDSGVRGESSCEACIGLSDPRRFARICPLVRYDDSSRGPRCSVGASEVRPFWGRVLAALGIVGLATALTLLVATFAAFRTLDYRIQPSDLLWPPHWSRLRGARADFYVRQGVAAYRRGDGRGSYLALLEAHALRPGDYAADRLLAQVAMPIYPDLADALFADLVRSPEALRSANAAQEWAVSLLAREQWAPLVRLSVYLLRRGATDSAGPWTNVLIFAERRLADDSAVRQLLAQPGALPPDSRTALQWSLQPDSDPLSAELLAAARSGASLYLRHYAYTRLIQAGRGSIVLAELARDNRLPPREMEMLRLTAWGELKWDDVRFMEIKRLIGSHGVSPALAELLAAQLISYPDAAGAALLFGSIERYPLALTAENYPVYAALVCLAGVNRDAERLRPLIAQLGRISGRPFGRETTAADIFLDRSPARSLSSALVALQPLSLEVMFAVLSASAQEPGAPAQ